MGYTYKGTQHDTAPKPRPSHWAKPGPKPRTELPPFNADLCGTMSGYRQHRLHGNEKCQPCKDANTAKSTEYRARRKEGG